MAKILLILSLQWSKKEHLDFFLCYKWNYFIAHRDSFLLLQWSKKITFSVLFFYNMNQSILLQQGLWCLLWKTCFMPIIKDVHFHAEELSIWMAFDSIPEKAIYIGYCGKPRDSVTWFEKTSLNVCGTKHFFGNSNRWFVYLTLCDVEI